MILPAPAILRFGLPVVMALCLGAKGAAASAAELNQNQFAIVAGEAISVQEYRLALQAGMRQRFYHGKIPEDKLKAFRREVGQSLIDRVLLLREARRRGIEPDRDGVEKQVQAYIQRYADSPQFKQNRAEMVAGLRKTLEEQALLQRLEASVREVDVPEPQAVREYYEAHPELFTTPQAFRVSIILLKVDPASSREVWQAAYEEAAGLLERLRGGAEFSELARIHSGDESATRGGDMGYLHQGMLAAPAERVIQDMEEGEISQPVMLLQGVAILRLDEIRAAQLNAFDAVVDRARGLLQRERSEHAWQALVQRLRDSAQVSINPSVR